MSMASLRFWLCVLSLLLMPMAVWAADKAHVDPAACRALVNYQPSADVNYKPGLDAHGKPVVPADLDGGSPSILPPVINIPLTISLAKVLNLDTTQYPYSQLGAGTEATLGTLSVQGNKVTLNGKSLSNQQQSDLAALCYQSK